MTQGGGSSGCRHQTCNTDDDGNPIWELRLSEAPPADKPDGTPTTRTARDDQAKRDWQRPAAAPADLNDPLPFYEASRWQTDAAASDPGPGAGRPKGMSNHMPRELKQMILEALSEAGGKEYLLKITHEDHKAFCQLLGRVLPMTVTGDKDEPLNTVSQIEFVIVNPDTDRSDSRTYAARPRQRPGRKSVESRHRLTAMASDRLQHTGEKPGDTYTHIRTIKNMRQTRFRVVNARTARRPCCAP